MELTRWPHCVESGRCVNSGGVSSRSRCTGTGSAKRVRVSTCRPVEAQASADDAASDYQAIALKSTAGLTEHSSHAPGCRCDRAEIGWDWQPHLPTSHNFVSP